MKIDDIKPLGAFVENTLRPLFAECSDFLKLANEYGLEINESNITRVLKEVARVHLKTVIIQSVRDVFIAIIVALILWTTFQ